MERKSKKQKKSKKDKKKKSSRRSASASPDHGTERESAPRDRDATVESVPALASQPSNATTETTGSVVIGDTDARSFFARLKQQESAKQAVGTVHASGTPAPSSATALSVADQWECSKAGCGHKNSKYAGTCNKCGAMKRMSEWR